MRHSDLLQDSARDKQLIAQVLPLGVAWKAVLD